MELEDRVVVRVPRLNPDPKSIPTTDSQPKHSSPDPNCNIGSLKRRHPPRLKEHQTIPQSGGNWNHQESTVCKSHVYLALVLIQLEILTFQGGGVAIARPFTPKHRFKKHSNS